jgi:hypothetical protein
VLVDSVSVPLESQLVDAPTPAILAVGIPGILRGFCMISTHPIIRFWIDAWIGEITTLFRQGRGGKLLTNASHKPG